jgi:predicted DNA-binding transcriptional regulator YafY
MTGIPKPLAFTLEELDILLLGLARIPAEADEALEAVVESARARIAEALPPEPPYRPRTSHTPQQRAILGAIAAEQRLRIAYVDGKGVPTERLVWPILLEGDMLAAWCEMRRDYRQFRLERIRGVEATGMPMPIRRRILRAEWLAQQEDRDG